MEQLIPSEKPTIEELVAALERASRGSASDELDRRFTEAIRGSVTPDAVLQRIPVERLAELVERAGARLTGEPTAELRKQAWDLLDLVRRPSVLRRIPRSETDAWAARLLGLVEASHYTVGPLFRQRASHYRSRTLFQLDQPGPRGVWSWRRVAARVEFLSRVLLSLDRSETPAPVAILSENRLEVALLDLACLTAGIVNVMVPANATESDVLYILEHSGVGTLIASGQHQLAKVQPHRERLARLRHLITLDAAAAKPPEIVALDALAPEAERVARSEPQARAERVRIGDLATVMYTSGTTGTPKGIQFSHRNIVFKRFARALALPEIGEKDVFLCFLPLYHTFGRFLEMLGCVFLGARYCFLGGTSPRNLMQGMRRHRPTVFISVPKKWMQLHEMIARRADPLEATDAQLAAATAEVTGGRLRWGLSAAGHLDADIFRFFQRQGVELVSGFGMTEATGGITMTPPGEYEDNSLGAALPGIELKLDDDGELLVRGPYVMMGYLEPEDGEPSFDDGWFRTGDLMEVTAAGHLRLVDRKKEIYKNIKGETIAPQRVENMFREFDSVGRAFLVGDHRDYNTLLIYPNPETSEPNLAQLSSQEVRDHFRSLVISVNQFLAPYERVVDFAIIDRDLDPERGELTPKGTPRRKLVERNFDEALRELYRRTNVRVGGVELVFPNWLFQILGLTAQDIRFEQEAVVLPSRGTRLTVGAIDATTARVGSCLYRHPDGPLDLGALLTSPRLWLGNEELVAFIALDAVTRQRTGRRSERIEWSGRATPYAVEPSDRQKLESFLGRDDLDHQDLHLAARMLASEQEVDALLAIRLLEDVLERGEGLLAEPARWLLARCAVSPHRCVRRRAFQVLVPAERGRRFKDVLDRFTKQTSDLFDAETTLVLAEQMLGEEQLETFIRRTRRICSGEVPLDTELARGLFGFLAAYGSVHPTGYRPIRAFLQRMSLFAEPDELRAEARTAADSLIRRFREWLGPTARIAVDPERGSEYRWEDVVAFDDAVPAGDRQRLLSAIKQTAFLREAVFLFSWGAAVQLSDIAPGGVRIRLLGRLHGKSVYRITVQTRYQGSFDLAANVNHDLSPTQVQEEIQWLVLSGDPGNRRDPLVEEFGGYWAEQDLWSEEFIAGETLMGAMQRLAQLDDHEERLGRLWPFMAWATLSAYVDFWYRSGKRLEIADPDMTNIVVPTQDFVAGVRIVSVSRRRPHQGLLRMLRAFREGFVAEVEQQYPFLAGVVDWPVVFSSVLEVLGEEAGLAELQRLLDDANLPDDDRLRRALADYLALVANRGFIPLRLFFAVERYRRWRRLSTRATTQARARMLRELFDTYGLQRLVKSYPEIRVQFYLETVFRDSSSWLKDRVKQIVKAIRDGQLSAEELIDAVDALRAEGDLDSADEYFLARLTFPHLRPQDEADFVRLELGDRRQSDLVVTLEDRQGAPFRVRHALNPKEVERLLRLFLAAKLDVRFRMEHQYLVAINERSHIIGGIYYEVDDGERSAHLEKIVVAERYRRQRVAHGLMNELIHRLRSLGVKTLTTGFFRPDFFEPYGFRVEKHHAGLVKDLTEVDPDRV